MAVLGTAFIALLERSCEVDPMARAYVELPQGWGPSRVVIVAWERAGYRVEREISMGSQESRLLVSAAERPGAVAGPS